LLVCLGEAMNTYEDDVEWMTKTIIPGVKDGLKDTDGISTRAAITKIFCTFIIVLVFVL
jgi:hypothetical protein